MPVFLAEWVPVPTVLQLVILRSVLELDSSRYGTFQLGEFAVLVFDPNPTFLKEKLVNLDHAEEVFFFVKLRGYLLIN